MSKIRGLPVSMFGEGFTSRAKGDSMVDAGIEEDDLLVIGVLPAPRGI